MVLGSRCSPKLSVSIGAGGVRDSLMATAGSCKLRGWMVVSEAARGMREERVGLAPGLGYWNMELALAKGGVVGAERVKLFWRTSPTARALPTRARAMERGDVSRGELGAVLGVEASCSGD